MTAEVAVPRRDGRSDSGALSPRASTGDTPRSRGRLDIAPRVIERIAEGSARAVRGVRPVHHRLGADALGVSARVLGPVASVQVELGVTYPSPVRETCRRVRQAVTADVRRLTGVEVSRLDLSVVDLQARGGSSPRVR